MDDTTEDPRTCATCPCFDKWATHERGDCKARPPVVVVIRDEPVGVWPKVRSTQWCNEHPKRLGAPADWLAVISDRLLDARR